MKYVIMGNPKAMHRPRFNMVTRTVYDDQKNERLVIGITLQKQHNNNPLLVGPLTLKVIFYMPMPIKAPPSQEGKPCYYKPDLDNLLKMLCDISTGIIFKNDCQIFRIFSEKRYSKNPRTEFIVKEINAKYLNHYFDEGTFFKDEE